MLTSRRRGFTLALAGACVLAVATAQAAPDPDRKCQKGRYDAAAHYASCHQKVLGKFLAGSYRNYDKFELGLSKCRVRYTGTWAKLRAKAKDSGVTCDNDRYDTTVAGTVIDRLTGLQWEKKQNMNDTQNLADPHDADNRYTWSAGAPYTEADGTAFRTFLPALNSGGCHAGHCDWRLPTVYELQTILLEPYPCTTSPCVDSVFTPTVADYYRSATTNARRPDYEWVVSFDDGKVFDLGGGNYNGAVRAVRAGL